MLFSQKVYSQMIDKRAAPTYLRKVLDQKLSIPERADHLLKLSDPVQRLEGALLVGFPDILGMCEVKPALDREFCSNNDYWLKLYELDFQLTLKEPPSDLLEKGWAEHYESLADFIFEDHSENDSDYEEWEDERRSRLAAMKKAKKL